MIARLFPILGITFIDILGFSILIPLMPYYVKHFGASDPVVGLVFSTFALCQLLAGPIWGNLSDQIGRKAVLIISQIGATVGWAMLAFAPNIGFVFLARIVEGVSGGNLSVTQAYVSDLVEPEKRGRAFAYVGAAFSGGLVFGPAFGGALVGRYGYTAPFLAAAFLQLITLAVTILVLPESRRHVEGEATSFADIIPAFRNARTAPVLVQKLVYAFGMYGWFAAFTLVLQRQLQIGVATTSYLFAAFGAASVVLQLGVIGRITDALGDRRASNLGFIALAASFAIVPFMHDYVTASAMVVLFSFGLSLENATFPALLSEAATERTRGTVLGAGSSLDSVAGVVMPPLSTGALFWYGVPAPVALAMGFAFAALCMGLAQSRRTLASEIPRA